MLEDVVSTMFAVIILRYTPGFILLATKDDCTADCADLADLLRRSGMAIGDPRSKTMESSGARSIIAAGCKELQVSLKELRRQAKSDWRKTLLQVIATQSECWRFACTISPGSAPSATEVQLTQAPNSETAPPAHASRRRPLPSTPPRPRCGSACRPSRSARPGSRR